jgi:alanyl-tRNA synthetase
MTTHDIKKKYLAFFEKNGHAIVPSSSLLPENDPTTLFTGSGMQPMVPYLLGQSHPLGAKIADSQKCFRAQDIEEVGDNRHTTFFEMLGNWSLGDYFKHEQIPWVFTFLTEVLPLNPNRLYVTCFRGIPGNNIPKDEESANIWKNLFQAKGIDAVIQDNAEERGMKQNARIFYYDETKNWWSRSGVPSNMPVGEPGGPDSEIFWDFGVDLGLHEQSEWKDVPCHVNCDCGRFLEIGNSVFMEYIKTENGFEQLKQKNVDFGGGLERMAAALNNNPDMFLIDLFSSMKEMLERISKKTYGDVAEETKAFRVILDHLRAATFLIADGAIPSNKDQGYFTRRLIRRAVRYGQTLGISDAFCAEVAGAVIGTYADAYPELPQKKDMILEALSTEEKKFKRTIEKGVKQFEDIAGAINDQRSIITGQEAFDLYQSFGFPIELTKEMAEEKGLSVDRDEFEKEKEKHAALSRQGAEKKFKGGLLDHSDMSVKYHTATHLLHAAVRKVLGEDAVQKGSNITPERLRFDFSYPNKLTPEQKQEIEELVNAAIERDYPMTFDMMSVDDARKKGAIGLFEDNYGDTVKVYTVGDPNEPATADPSAPTFSREFCGGPHVEHTGTLGRFKIKKEESVGAGARRIKAVLE